MCCVRESLGFSEWLLGCFWVVVTRLFLTNRQKKVHFHNVLKVVYFRSNFALQMILWHFLRQSCVLKCVLKCAIL